MPIAVGPRVAVAGVFCRCLPCPGASGKAGPLFAIAIKAGRLLANLGKAGIGARRPLCYSKYYTGCAPRWARAGSCPNKGNIVCKGTQRVSGWKPVLFALKYCKKPGGAPVTGG